MTNPANLDVLRSQYAGTRFANLVQHHLQRQSQAERVKGLQATIAGLPVAARPLAEGYIDRWNRQAYDRDFWQRDTASVFDEITADARRTLESVGVMSNDEAVLDLFNIVVLNYAYSAHDQPKMRGFMGIGSSFSWPSTIALLYPVSAMLYLARTTPASLVTVLGYGIANLGYVLLASGVVAGSFKVLGLRGRALTISAGIVALVVGTVLSSVGS